MCKKYLLSFFVFFSVISSMSLGARTLEGEGYGSSQERAQKAALAALASNIYVNVESKSSTYQDTQGANDFSFEATVTTNIPVFGVKYDCAKEKKDYFCTATLDTNTANQLYKREIRRLVNDINNSYDSLVSADQATKLELLYSILTKLEQYEKLSVVAGLLSSESGNWIKPKATKQQVSGLITKQQSAVSSLNVAAKLISRNINEKNVYIQPVTPLNSREVTPFSSALTDEIKAHLQTVPHASDASFILAGRYNQTNSGIKVSYELSDKSGNTLKSFVINLTPESYSQYRTTPLAPDFDKLLHSGYAVSSKFKASLATNKGMRGLLFKEGESVELLTKVNRPGYFYIVGHTKNTELEQSYLMELNEGSGDRRFIIYVNADEVNKWVSLGEFVVEKPFGLESLQLMASTHDLWGMLPSYQYSSMSGYYVISNDIEEGVRKTRGLKKVKVSSPSVSESVLLFTTESN